MRAGMAQAQVGPSASKDVFLAAARLSYDELAAELLYGRTDLVGGR
jgi:hypothetical protein